MEWALNLAICFCVAFPEKNNFAATFAAPKKNLFR